MKSQQPPAFGMEASTVQAQAAPVQRKGKKPVVPKTEAEIAAKVAELEADPSIIKPGVKWNPSDRTDKDITDAAAKRYGIKREVESYSPTFCGRGIVGGLNTLCKEKVDKVNAAFGLLDKKVQEEITTSLQHVTGTVYRVQSGITNMDKELEAYGLKGYWKTRLSDHAMGCALDINENMSTKQNHHWKKGAKKKGEKKAPKADRLLMFMESIVQKYDSTFDLDKSEGLDQLRGINSFPAHLNIYVNSLLGNLEAVDMFADEKNVKQKLSECKTDQDNCKVILANWDTFKGYAKGTRLEKVTVGKGKKAKQVEKVSVLNDPSELDPGNKDTLDLIGVIPFHETFVKIMLEAGWAWGGQNSSGYGAGNKDYMHFEDQQAMDKMKTPKTT